MIDLRDMTPEEVERRFQCGTDGYAFKVSLKDRGGFVGAYRRYDIEDWRPCRWAPSGVCYTTKVADLIPRREEVEVWAFALCYDGEWLGGCCTSLDAAKTRVHNLKVGDYRTAGPERVVLKENVE